MCKVLFDVIHLQIKTNLLLLFIQRFVICLSYIEKKTSVRLAKKNPPGN